MSPLSASGVILSSDQVPRAGERQDQNKFYHAQIVRHLWFLGHVWPNGRN